MTSTIKGGRRSVEQNQSGSFSSQFRPDTNLIQMELVMAFIMALAVSDPSLLIGGYSTLAAN